MKGIQNYYRGGLVFLAVFFGLVCDNTFAQNHSVTKDLKNSETWVPASYDTIPSNQHKQLTDLLDNSLHSLAEKDHQGRMIGGYVLLGLGAGSAVGGAVTLAAAQNDDARIVGYSLMGGGAFLGALSVLPFKIRSESERLYDDFSEDLKNRSSDDIQHFYYWDRRFQELAEKRKRERIIGGVSSIVVGGVASLITEDVSDRERLHIFLWPAVGGVTSFLIKSEEEQRYETYRQAKEDLLRQSAISVIRFGIIPTPEGGILGSLYIEF